MRVKHGKTTSYYASFCFTDPASGKELKREMALPGRAEYEAAKSRYAVTVLYNPRRPRRALVYELSGYRVEGAD
jgi:hypothetical protein